MCARVSTAGLAEVGGEEEFVPPVGGVEGDGMGSGEAFEQVE